MPCAAGAGGGYTTLLFQLLWPQARVVALEPEPASFALLRHNTAGCVGGAGQGRWSQAAGSPQDPLVPHRCQLTLTHPVSPSM